MAETPVVVFLAEDDEDALELLSMVLHARGFAVTQCRNGRELVEAVTTAESGEPPLIILADLEMPELDGVNAVREITKSSKPRVFFMTALRDAPLLEQARAVGERVFHKPLDIEHLVATIQAAAETAA